MRRILKVWCYNNRDEFRFYVSVSIPIFSLKTKGKTEKEKEKLRRELDRRIDLIIVKKTKDEIRKAREKFRGFCYGASWSSIKLIRYNGKTCKL